MDIEAHRDLQLLEAVEQDARVTQRTLSFNGIALGLTNIYLSDSFARVTSSASTCGRRIVLITPRGIVEKARLTYKFAGLFAAPLRGRAAAAAPVSECAAGGRRSRSSGAAGGGGSPTSR
jgi:hypothetical protein